MRAFDMSKYQRVIATEGDVRGSFVVHGAPDRRIFKVDILDVVLWDPERQWGRVIRPGEFDIDVDDDGTLRVGQDIHPDKVHDVEEFRERIDAILVLVAAAFTAGPGSVVEETGDSEVRS